MRPLNFEFLDLEILLVGKDPLGYYAKTKVILKGNGAVIRWGLDYLTYRALNQVCAHFSSVNSLKVILNRWTLERQITIRALLNNEVVQESRFRCSSSFLANILWLAEMDDAGQLDSVLWSNFISEPACGEPVQAASLLSLTVSGRRKKASHSMIHTASMVIVLGIFMLRCPSLILPQSTTVKTQGTQITKTNVVSSTLPSTAVQDSASRPNNPDSNQAAFHQTMTKAVTTVPLIWKVSQGEVALTIDDGPSPYTLSFIHILQENHVHATFFFVGSRVHLWPSAVQAAFRAGDVVGVHTQTHPILTNLSMSEQSWEIMTAVKEIQSVKQGPVVLFRPPYGDFNQDTKQILAQHHMTMVLWNSDPRDWAAVSAAQIVNAVMDNHPSGKVVALNETPLTLQALPKIIELLKQHGLRLVVLTPQS